MEANKTPNKHAHAWVWQILLALAAYLARFLLTRYTVVTAAVLAVPCIFVGARWGVWAGVAVYVCAGALGFVLDEPLAAPDDAVWFCMRLSSSDAVSKALAICGSLSTV